jgi:hypothetical protein
MTRYIHEGRASKDEQAYIKEQIKNGEYAGTCRQLEEGVGTGHFTQALADVAHNAAMKGYGLTAPDWRKIVSIRNVSDFKVQYATILDSLGKLDQLDEHEPYKEAIPVDNQENYTPTRWGKKLGLTMEARFNDATGLLTRAFTKWGAAWNNTLNYYTFYTLMDANPTMGQDSVALFHASSHSNLGTAMPMNFDNLSTAIEAMMAQTDNASEAIAPIMPRYVVVTADLYAQTWNPWSGKLEIIVSPHITSGYWYLVANPAINDTIELGFLNGKTEPEIQIAGPDHQAEFDNDTRYSRIKGVFAGTALDWRCFCNNGATLPPYGGKCAPPLGAGPHGLAPLFIKVKTWAQIP